MGKVLRSKYVFNNGILQVQFHLDDIYSESNLAIAKVKFYNYDVDSSQYIELSEDDGEVVELDQNHTLYDVDFNDHKDHLVKAKIYVDANNWPSSNAPCCATQEIIGVTTYWIFTEYFVDLYQIKTEMLNQLNFTCNDDCNVSLDIANKLLKVTTLQVATDTNSDQLESMFSCLIANKKSNFNDTHSTCNCNG